MGGKRTERTTRESPGCSTTNENQALGPALQIRCVFLLPRANLSMFVSSITIVQKQKLPLAA